MGVFDDKKFEQLDWVSQITETIDSEVNGLLARLPDKLQLDQSSVISFMEQSYGGLRLSLGSVVRHIIRTVKDRPKLSYEDEQTIIQCFQFEVSNDLEIDFESGTMQGELFLVKTVTTIEDEELQKTLGQQGVSEVSRIDWKLEYVGRANEVMELLGGLDDQIRGRAMRKKRNAIVNRLSNIFEKNEWRIRDAQLANKIGKWIAEYIETGNLASFSNFCKIKVMTHQNMPIYSIEEQQ